MREFICDYSKIAPDVLANLITTKICTAWATWHDINEDCFELDILEGFRTVPTNWTEVQKIINPYLYKG